MIPKEKIESQLNNQNIPSYRVGFREGVSFAETELQSISIEFAEWCGSEGWIQEAKVNNWKNILDIKIPELVRMSTTDLFAKFMAERGQG